ncbi:hypothetical protein ACOSP7_022566 [Xanthoceras sorbifolium]
MENSSSSCDLHLPVRSISLPTRIHPTSVKLESALNHLKTWQISCPVIIGAEMLQNGLVGLAEMYNCMEEFINSSTQTQQALLRHGNGQLVEEALDKSVTLIDTCSSARDLLLTMKENVQALQSTLRRRRGSGDYSSIENEIASYIACRKKMKKDISKSLQALKKLEIKNKTTVVDHHQHDLSFTIKVLGESTAITISIFRSLLIFVSMPAKLSGWSLISKLMKTRLSSSSDDPHHHQKMINQVESVDFAVHSLLGSSRSSSTTSSSSNNDKASEVNMTQKMLQGLSVSIEGLETGLDSMFKCLVHNRVSFLNILAN